MNRFFDLFSHQRRRTPRIAVRWFVDAQVYGSQEYSGFYTCDISCGGVRLEGDTPQSIRRFLSPDGRARLRIHLPHRSIPLRAEAELKWGLGDPFRTGWAFTRIDPEDERILEEYIATHSGQIIREEPKASRR